MHNRALLISPRNRVFETLNVPPFANGRILKTLTQKWINTAKRIISKRRAQRTRSILNTKKSALKCVSAFNACFYVVYSSENCSQASLLWTNISQSFERDVLQSFLSSKDSTRGRQNFRKRYLLVAVRSPDHHGLFVGDLAGGDGVDLLDVLDLGNGLHVYILCAFIK
jgi:hypothetical protein